MRGTVAKRLRKKALASTIGAPWVRYESQGKLHLSCTRRVYKTLKKWFKSTKV